MSEPSQKQSNQVLRVLKEERMKYTFNLHKPDGTVVEFQCNEPPKVVWHDGLRKPMLQSRDYEGHPIMEWIEGSILLGEENPK